MMSSPYPGCHRDHLGMPVRGWVVVAVTTDFELEGLRIRQWTGHSSGQQILNMS